MAPSAHSTRGSGATRSSARCSKLRACYSVTKFALKKRKPARGNDSFGQRTTDHLSYRNDLLARIALRVPGRVAALESPCMGSLRRLRAAGVAASRVHVVNKSPSGGFRRKAQRLGATPHVCLFHELPEHLPAGVEILYYDGTRGSPANVYAELAPFLTLGDGRPKVLLVTVAKRSSNYVPQTTRVLSLMKWLEKEGAYEPLGGWRCSAEAISSGKVYCFAMQRLGDRELGGPILQVPEEFRLREGAPERRPGAEELLRRLKELERLPAPPTMSSQKYAVAGRAEALRDALERGAAGPTGARLLRRLKARGPRWFWSNFDAWRGKPAGSRSRVRNLPEGQRRKLFLGHFEALTAALVGRIDAARRPLLLLRHTSPGDAAALSDWASRAFSRRVAQRRERQRFGEAVADVVVAPLLEGTERFEDLEAGLEEAKMAAEPGGLLVVTLRSRHDATTLLWALKLQASLSSQGFLPLPCFDARMLVDLSELATVVLRKP